jgi:hypothetical protein
MAAERFAATHASDPHGAAADYHARLERWVRELAGDPSEAVILAAQCQHLGRWKLPRSDYPPGRRGYKRWRSRLAHMHADDAEVILRDAGYGDDAVERVRALLLKKGLKTDPEVQLFEDAICLAFMEGELEAFVDKHDDDKVVRILQKTWKKMSAAGHEAAKGLVASLDDRTQSLVARALAEE